jgi:hypothetical protein
MLRRFTNNYGTTILPYPFGIEEHQYSSAGTNQWNTYYYFLAGRLLRLAGWQRHAVLPAPPVTDGRKTTFGISIVVPAVHLP